MSGKLLDTLYETNWKLQMKTLMSEAKIFGLTIFGDGATIKTIPLINILAAGVNNSFALLDVVDCSNQASAGKKKDAKFIARLIHPFVEKIEMEGDGLSNNLTGVVDLVFFDGATNVQNAGKILAAMHPRISVGHGAEHVVSLFFSDVFKKCDEFAMLSKFSKTCRNIWGSTTHKTSAMFKKYSKVHNNGVYIGFIKPSDCRMAGELIALLRLLRLKNGLQATVVSPEFKSLKEFEVEATVLMNEDFWKYVFVMCRALYAPMRVLRLADQKTPGMDKLYYYVLQADRMLPKWLTDAEEHSKHLMSSSIWRAMETPRLGSESDIEDNVTDDSEDDCDSVEADAEAENGDEISEDEDDEEIDHQELR